MTALLTHSCPLSMYEKKAPPGRMLGGRADIELLMQGGKNQSVEKKKCRLWDKAGAADWSFRNEPSRS